MQGRGPGANTLINVSRGMLSILRFFRVPVEMYAAPWQVLKLNTFRPEF
jgi:hypothetical protein